MAEKIQSLKITISRTSQIIAPSLSFNGKNIKEIAKIARGKDKLDDQIAQILEMYEKGGAQMVYQVMDEPDVQNIMKQPFTMIASDAGVRRFGSGRPAPAWLWQQRRVLGVTFVN
jgi:N-acyl-D-amino-acid deacylase